MSPVQALAPYASLEARTAEFERLAGIARAEVIEYGSSVEGRPLRAVRVPCTKPTGSPPRVLCSANIHGLEFVSGSVALGLLDALGRGDAAAAELRALSEIWVIACLNPDGYARTWEAGGDGALPTLRCNANRVDLNRNFPLPGNQAPSQRIPWAGSDREGSANYRGPSALSEPESSSLHKLLEEEKFHASTNLHAFMGALIPARVREKEPYRTYAELCRAFRSHQHHSRYHRLATRWGDVFTGELEDHQHHSLRTWAVCVETFSLPASFRQHVRAPSVFWRFNPRDPARWVANDVPGVIGFLRACLLQPRPEPPR